MKKKTLFACLLLSSLLLSACAGNNSVNPANSKGSVENTEGVESEITNTSDGNDTSEGTDASNEDASLASIGSSSDSKEMYMSFLKGSAPVYVDKITIPEVTDYEDGSIVPSFKKNTPYTISEFVTINYNLQHSDYSANAVTSVGYQFIDCGNDGEPELAINITYQTTAMDNLEFQYIIKNIDGKLELCCAIHSYYRFSQSIMNKYGLIESFGSSGAMAHSEGYSYVNKDGEYIFLYSAETEYALGSTYGDLGGIYSYTSKYADEIDPEWALISYTFKNPNDIDYEDFNYEEYLSELKYTAEPIDKKLITDIFNEADIRLFTSEEIDSLLEKNNLSRGMTPDIFEERELLEFIPVENKEINEFIQYGINPVHVTNTEELISAINDDTTIVLSPGVYNITEYLKDNTDTLKVYSYDSDNQKGIYYYDASEPEIFICQVDNLKLVSLSKEDPAQVVCEPRYAQVMTFENCDNVTLDNLIMGHTPEQGVCSGDVVSMNRCNSGYINNCDLYGCGAYGINISSCGSIRMFNSTIHDCSYGCAEIFNTSSVFFENCNFVNCREYTMFVINSSNADFYNCTFKDLEGDILSMNSDSYVYFNSCLYDCNTLNQLNSYIGKGNLNIY